MTPMDAIWLVLVLDSFLLILATPVKKLSKMAGNSASYSPNSWWIDRL